MDEVRIQGNEVRATSPEGQVATVDLAQLIELIAPPQMETLGVVLPDGVKFVRSRGGVTVWAYAAPPQVCNFVWIAESSRMPFGQGATYRTVRIALPYLVVLAVFERGEGGVVQLSHRNECFFRTAPLQGPGDELLYPALLNCSKFTPQDGHPLSWICTAKMARAAFAAEPDPNRRLRAGFKALLHCLLETGFNLSSEHHEGSSWFTESRRVDPRVATVAKWEAATEKDSLFVLDVPWLTTGMSLGQVVERIFRNAGARGHSVASSRDIARIVFNHNGSS